MKRFLTSLFILRIVLAGNCLDVPLYPGTVLRFATLEEGREILGTVDDYIRNVSLFQRQAIVGRTNDVTEEKFLQFLANQALEWDAETMKCATVNVKRTAEMLKKLDLNLPNVIYLIETTGRDHDYSCYTRQNAIMIPVDSIYDGYIDDYVLVHEIFHILSRYNPTLRDELYSIIGYKPCGGSIEYPDSLTRLTNPDAPAIAHYINIKYKGTPLSVVPIYYSSSDTFTSGTNLYSYWKYGFMAIENTGDGWTYQSVDGEPLILNESALEGYWEQVGENTDYDIHPEERLAENFHFLCAGRAGQDWSRVAPNHLPTPRILEELEAILARSQTSPEWIAEPLREYTVGSNIYAVGFSVDGTEILTFSDYSDTKITTWDTNTGLKLDSFQVGPLSGVLITIQFIFDGKYVLIVNMNQFTIWDVRNKQKRLTSNAPRSIWECAVSPDGTQFLTCSDLQGGYVTFWDTTTGLERNSFQRQEYNKPVAYSPDASKVLIGKTLYNVETFTSIESFDPPARTGIPLSCMFSPDGSKILIAEHPFWTGEGAVRLWDAVSGEELRSFAFCYWGFPRAIFSPDGKLILITGSGSENILWDADGKAEIRILSQPNKKYSWIAAFSPDCKKLLTASEDYCVQLWDISDLSENTTVVEWYLH